MLPVWACRLIPAGCGALLFAALAALRATGAPGAYFAYFDFLNVDAWAFPFLDTDAILAALDCHRLGVDVYGATNPCDPLGRSHVYPPLWLHLARLPIGRDDLNVIGLTLDLAFIAALTAMPPVRTRAGLAIFVLALGSPAVVLALERANNDVLVFVAGIAAGWLVLRVSAVRFLAYAIAVPMAALKFYPIVWVILAWRERWQICLTAGILSGAVLAAFFVAEWDGVQRGLALIPRGIRGSIGASDLPGFLALGRPAWLATAIEACLLWASVVVAIGGTARVRQALTHLPDAERVFLTIGAVSMGGCFLMGQSAPYRAMLLLFALPGLLAIAGEIWARIGIGLSLYVLWIGAIRWPAALDTPMWMVEQAAWWALFAILLTILIALFADSRALLSLRGASR